VVVLVAVEEEEMEEEEEEEEEEVRTHQPAQPPADDAFARHGGVCRSF
jgi:CO dehydrogenase/acetyl-CoA synthase beta subunit